MKKLLYFTHVPWGWIKQRPQFIAEQLSQTLDLSYVEGCSIKSIFKKNSSSERSSTISYKRYFRLPKYNPILAWRFKLLDFINELLLRLSIRLKHYDYVWITSIESFFRIENLLTERITVIYDCMDDELEFPQVCNNIQARNLLSDYEKRLVKRADILICSADHLKQQIIKRTLTQKHIHVINNATVFPNIKENFEYRDEFKFLSGKHSMLYIGTIAKWFDFESVIYLLNYDINLVCYLVGPVETELPNHDRLVHLGKCQHSEIWGLMKQADLLMMPFIINPLIESVNPVKLYEYIWAEKPIIATRYGESIKFDDYCYLYSSKEDILEIYKKLKEGAFPPKQTSVEQIKCFINNNTWNSRCNEIIKISKIEDIS